MNFWHAFICFLKLFSVHHFNGFLSSFKNLLIFFFKKFINLQISISDCLNISKAESFERSYSSSNHGGCDEQSRDLHWHRLISAAALWYNLFKLSTTLLISTSLPGYIPLFYTCFTDWWSAKISNKCFLLVFPYIFINREFGDKWIIWKFRNIYLEITRQGKVVRIIHVKNSEMWNILKHYACIITIW